MAMLNSKLTEKVQVSKDQKDPSFVFQENQNILKKVLKEYHEYLQRARSVTLRQAKRAKNSTQEHKLIADAIKNHDCASAEKYAKAHIESTMLNIDKLGWENLIE